MLSEIFGRRVQQARLAAGLTQHELGQRLGIRPVSVSRIECGVSLPPLGRAADIARILGRSLDWLTGADGRLIPKNTSRKSAN